MKTYIYGEVYLKTKKHLYLITVINMILQDKGCYYDVYKLVSSYSHNNKRLTNTFYHSEGNTLITELREGNKLFCKVQDKKLYNAIIKRFHPIKQY
jgi:hypothetical protein